MFSYLNLFHSFTDIEVNINGQLMVAYDLKHVVQNFINHTQQACLRPSIQYLLRAARGCTL